MKPIIKIHRYQQDHLQSLGSCVVLLENSQPAFASLSLERGWQDNKKSVSCYPAGVYEVELEMSDKFGKLLWEVKGVPNRSECKFHAANFWKQLNGCTALGVRPKDIDKDGYIDITSSKSTMDDFHKALDGHTKALLIVTCEPNLH